MRSPHPLARFFGMFVGGCPWSSHIPPDDSERLGLAQKAVTQTQNELKAAVVLSAKLGTLFTAILLVPFVMFVLESLLEAVLASLLMVMSAV